MATTPTTGADADHPRRLVVAACQFAVTGSIEANLAAVKRQLERAASLGADVAHFPEGALGGYAGWDFESFAGYDWTALRAALEQVVGLARELGIWVVLGSNHRLSDGHKPHNSLYVIDPDRGIAGRYDKCFCMGASGEQDLAHYTPGSALVTHEIHGVRCGFLICHDWRYPEVYRQLKVSGAELVFQSWYDGNIPDAVWRDGGDVNVEVLPATVVGHAVCNALWISAVNTSARHSAMGPMLVRPDGRIAGKGPRNRAQVLVSTVDTGLAFEDLAAHWRDRAIAGTLHSGDAVDDPRSRDRTCY